MPDKEGEETTSFVESVFNPDGTFKDGWKEHAVDEELRGEKILDTFSDAKGVFKTLVHQGKAIGKDKVAIPTETSSDEEWDAFYRANGRPETSKDYKLERPEAIPEESWDADRVAQFQDLAHSLGLNQKQVAGLFAFQSEYEAQALEAMRLAEEEAPVKAKEALQAKWGAAYDQRLHLANRVISETTEAGDERDAILQKIGNDPIIADWIAGVGEMLVESKSLDTRIDTQTPNQMQSEIDELMATPGYLNGTLKQENAIRYKQVHNKITDLYQQMAEVQSRAG